MAATRHIASKCRLNLLDVPTHMMILRRYGGILGEVRRFSTSKPHNVRGKMLLGENWSKFGVKAFDDGNLNLNPLSLKGKGAPCQFYFSSTAIHSDSSSVIGNIPRGRENRSKRINKFKTLLDEDTSGGTESSTTRVMFHDMIRSLLAFVKPWAADASIKLLEKMWAWDKAGNKRLTPTTATYNIVLAVIAKSKDASVRKKAVVYLDELENIYDNTKDEQWRPNTHSYNKCLKSFRKAASREEAMQAEKVLERMQKVSDHGHGGARPDELSMTCVITAWSNYGTKDGIERAENILDWLLSLYADGHKDLKPNIYTFMPVMNALALQGDSDRVEAMIRRMEKLSLRPDVNSYNALLRAYCHKHDRRSAKKAEEVLQKMIEMHKGGEVGVKPDKVTFTRVLQCHANHGDIAKVERGIQALEALSLKKGHSNFFPDTFAYNTLIVAYANSIRIDAPEKAEMIIEKMQQLDKIKGSTRPNIFTYNKLMRCYGKNGNAVKVKSIIDELKRQSVSRRTKHLRPNSTSYHILVYAYAHSNADDGPVKAEATINLMQGLYAAGEIDRNYDISSFNTLMKAYARTGDAAKVESIIEELKNKSSKEGNGHLCPDIFSYNNLINAYANSDADDALENAEAVLELMYKLYESGDTNLKPDRVNYNTIMKCHANRGNVAKVESIIEELKNKSFKEKNENLLPNSISYTTLINAHANSLDTDACKKAEMVLKEMEDLYESGDACMEPDIDTFNALMSSYAKCGDVEKVDSMITGLEKNSLEGGKMHLVPNTATYNTLIEAFAKSERQDAPKRAEATLEKMQSLRERGDVDVEPNVSSLNLVLVCHAHGGKVHDVEEFVNHMEKLRAQTEFEHLRPNTETYNILIDTWVKSGDVLGADKAESTLTKMKQLQNQGYNSAAPDLNTYSSIVDAYKRSNKDLPSYLMNEFEMLKNGE